MRSILLCVLAACGTHQAGGMGGPSMNNRVEREPEAEPAPAAQSNDILAREAVTSRSQVKHILVAWKTLIGAYPGGMDERAAARTAEEAEALAVALLGRVRAGEPIEPLMAEHSEDPGSAYSGIAYEVTPAAELVYEFKRLGLRLEVGEAGLVLTRFGWHVIKRVE